MVSRVINHMIRSNCAGTLLFPKRPPSPCWPLLFDTDLIWKQYVTDVLEFNETDRMLQPENYVNFLFARGRFSF